jgi:hypothetical protein
VEGEWAVLAEGWRRAEAQAVAEEESKRMI